MEFWVEEFSVEGNFGSNENYPKTLKNQSLVVLMRKYWHFIELYSTNFYQNHKFPFSGQKITLGKNSLGENSLDEDSHWAKIPWARIPWAKIPWARIP